MRRLGHLFCAFLLFCAAARAGDWTIIPLEGRDYLTMRNVAEFYGLNDYEEVSNTLTISAPGRSVRGTVGSNELYINGLKFILSYPIEEVDGEPVVSRMDLTKIIEPVMRPSRIKDAAVIDSVVLDPGHGGHDNGATSYWGYEKDYALDVARRAKPMLEAQGLTVYMTREDDEFIPLEDRVGFANEHPTALFVAIHFNAGDPEANGIETYTLAPRGVPSMAANGPMLSDLEANPGNVCDAENMALACAMHAALITHSRLYDRGIKRARFVVIRDITIPGVLIEGGFLTNPNDAALIATDEYREEVAESISTAVRNYRNAVNEATPEPPPMVAGRDVTVRDDAPVPPPAATPPPPIGEPPPGAATPDVAAVPAPPSAPAPANPPASTAPAAAPTAEPPVQAQNEPISRSILTPIVD
jgi:N-acetylmuramoyl-L-alanine amidase